MIEIIPGIYQIDLPAPVPGSQLIDVNAYLIRGEGEWMLVDTGWNTRYTFSILQNRLGQIGARLEDITLVVITHFHPDHYGLVGKLKQVSPAKVAMHQIEVDLINSRYLSMDQLLSETAAALKLHGVPEDELPLLQNASLEVRKYVSPFTPEVVLNGGETIAHGEFAFQVVWTPGHSPGHICLYEPRCRLLLSGDHMLPTIFPNVGLHPQSGPDPLGDYRRSLQSVEKLDVDLVLPAHEYPFTLMKRRVGELLAHLDQRRESILDVVRQGAHTVYQVSSEIPWIVNGSIMSFSELSPLDKRLAVMSALAHLEPLSADGLVKKTREDGTLLYRAQESA